MDASGPIVAKIRTDSGDQIIYENRKLADFFYHYPYYWAAETAHQKLSISAEVTIILGNKEYDRRLGFDLPVNERQHEVEVTKTKVGDRTFEDKRLKVKVLRHEYENIVLRAVRRFEDDFYLSEQDLINKVQELFYSENNYCFFRKQVEIGDRVADGLAIIADKNSPSSSEFEIIAFEVKSNADRYDRLFRQLTAYMEVADKVYLVIQDKKPPADLPFFVGIIKTAVEGAVIVKKATRINKSIKIREIWNTHAVHYSNKAGVDIPAEGFFQFFEFVENMKRKLLWNKFVIGWHDGWDTEHEDLDKLESQLFKKYFELTSPGSVKKHRKA